MAQVVSDMVESMEKLRLDQLIPMQGNLKNLEKAEYDKLKKSILELGFSAPFFAWRDEKGRAQLLDGHQRSKVLGVLAGEGAQLPDAYPVVFIKAKDKKDAAQKLLVITSNYGRTTQEGLSDFAIDFGIDMNFIEDFTRIPDVSFDLPEETPSPVEGEDDAPEVPDKSVVEVGDVWILGQHRLMCGDSTDAPCVDMLMDRGKADMVFTDPPYGMSAVSKSGVLSENKKYRGDIMNDDSPDVAKRAFKLAASIGIPKLVFWGANYYCSSLPDSTCWLVWDKNNGQSDQMDCELAWTNLPGVTRQFTKASEKINRVHPTQKPVELIEWCLHRFDAGDVLDLFGGSGSTLIACEKTNRKCYMMELDPHYCSVIIERWQKFAGKVAVRESDGVEYNSLTSD
jgi:16S rRNA G966 N2-methylase RsmD